MLSVLRFGEFQLEPDRRVLLKNTHKVNIGGRALDLLILLVGNRGRVVSKRETFLTVWDGLEVEEANLYVQIGFLRKLLGSAVIATVASRGYRFVADVEEFQLSVLFRPDTELEWAMPPMPKTLVHPDGHPGRTTWSAGIDVLAPGVSLSGESGGEALMRTFDRTDCDRSEDLEAAFKSYSPDLAQGQSQPVPN